VPSLRRLNVLLFAAIFIGLAAFVGYRFVIGGANGSGSPDFELCGADILGETVAPDLVRGFLRHGGASLIESTGPESGNATISAMLPGASAPTRVRIEVSDSSTAFTLLEGAMCQIGMSSRPITSEEGARKRLLGRAVGIDGVVPVVNPANRLERLDEESLREIFTGRLTNWSQRGGDDRPIAIFLSDDAADDAPFRSVVLHGAEFSRLALRVPGSQVPLAVARDPAAIGLSSFARQSPARPLQIVFAKDGAVAANPLTIKDGRYPIVHELYLYTSDPAFPPVSDFLSYVESDDGQAILNNDGFVSVL
jgi:phosphate transport system substrate-binding protein